MHEKGLSRPGAMLMVASAILMLVSAIGPVFLAVMRPTHEWLMVLSGFPAFAIISASALTAVLYFVGFLRYCVSKGYSSWLGFWLFLGNVPGFIVLLLLPDRKGNVSEQVLTLSEPAALSRGPVK
jgi:hypothetical protein